VRCIQTDPLDVVGHNQELVLQARVADFKPLLLEKLLYEDRVLVDGLDKQMSIYPVEDRPCFSRQREIAIRRFGGESGPAVRILPEVRNLIETRGPLSSIDLEHDEIVDWPWAPTRMGRAALESMFLWGELVIHHKVHTRKVYDLASRHISKDILDASDPNRTEEEYRDWHVLRRVRSVGLLWGRSGEAWLEIPGVKSKERTAALQRLCGRGRATAVEVEGIPHPFYIASEDAALLSGVDRGRRIEEPRASILAPLDNILWDRNLVRVLFGFDYVWEVYKPVAERRFGYYVLPVLYGDRFIARFEPGRDPESGDMIIRRWWWERGVKQTRTMRDELRRCFKGFLRYLGARAVRAAPKARAAVTWLP
jgi:uncharacterized protein YcaQ